jgi:peptidoglycan biosynthesis protein MviN/MurJ (putative lipid II flippase)
MKPMKHNGLALANAVAASVNFTILFFMLRKKLGWVEGSKIAASFIRISAASAVAGLISWITIRGDMWTQGGRAIEKAGIMAGVAALFLAVYFLITYALGSEELRYIARMYREKKGKTE